MDLKKKNKGFFKHPSKVHKRGFFFFLIKGFSKNNSNILRRGLKKNQWILLNNFSGILSYGISKAFVSFVPGYFKKFSKALVSYLGVEFLNIFQMLY